MTQHWTRGSTLQIKYDIFIIVEDNFKSGLFNSICEWIVSNNLPRKKVYSISPLEKYEEVLGDQEYLENIHGLTAEKINHTISNVIIK